MMSLKVTKEVGNAMYLYSLISFLGIPQASFASLLGE